MKRILILLLLTGFFSCKEKNKQQPVSEHPVPSMPVDIKIYPDNALNFKIQSIGGWMYITGGINGIIVYRKSQEEFVAIERTSSQLPNDAGASVKVLSDNFTLRDTVSGSQWRMFDGTITKGPAEWPLRLYGTSYDGNLLRIIN